MYKYLFDNTEILYPISWDENLGVVENVNTSEAGTDIIQVTRLGKLTVKAQFKCTETWVAVFEEFAGKDTFTLTRYDALAHNKVTHTVRMRNYNAKLVKNSWKLSGYNGLWEVSFTLLEV